MPQETPLGRTGSAEYVLKGMWVIRRTPTFAQRYDTLDGFVRELLTGALGGSWRETQQGARIIDRFIN